MAEIEAEQRLVDANRELIERFEKKIQAVLARVWGEEASAVPEAEVVAAQEPQVAEPKGLAKRFEEPSYEAEPLPKKGGRPRKTAAAPAASRATAEKKKRGRPRKG